MPMKKFFLRLAFVLLCMTLVLPLTAAAAAYKPGAPYQKELRTWIQNDERRRYVEMMLD